MKQNVSNYLHYAIRQYIIILINTFFGSFVVLLHIPTPYFTRIKVYMRNKFTKS